MGPVLQNGSVMAVWLRSLFNFDDLTGLGNGEFRDEMDQATTFEN
jgi:hypothetical protein